MWLRARRSRRRLSATGALVLAAMLAGTPLGPVSAQTAMPAPAGAEAADPGGPVLLLATARELVAPVALYPDPILAAVLDAATTPLDVVEAERFLTRRAERPDLPPDPAWSPAVVALLNHPELLRRMSEDLAWTRALGSAVVSDLPVVQEAIQQIRRGALALGILADTEFQRVLVEDDLVAIEPVDPEQVRLPVYDAEQLLAALPPSAVTDSLAAPTPSSPAEPAAPVADRARLPADLAPPPPRPIAVAPDAAALAPAVERYPAAPAPLPAVEYGPPERGFWSDAAIFAGGAVLGGVLGYLLADRDDDRKVVKKYYYFGDRRPPGWWRHRIDWRDDDWRPNRRIVRVDKIVIKDSNVLVTGNDVIVRRLGERRLELVKTARSGDLPPERWHDYWREHRRPAKIVIRSDGDRDRPVLVGRAAPAPAVGPAAEARREAPRIAVLPERRGEVRAERASGRDQRRAERRVGEAIGGGEPRPAAQAEPMREEVRRLERERARAEKTLARQRARETAAQAAAARAQHEERAREQRRLAEAAATRARAEAQERQRLEKARAQELARAEAAQRRQAIEQEKLLRREERRSRTLERREQRELHRTERVENQARRGDGKGKKRLPEE